MEVTIATHNRPKVDRLHNMRDPVRVENEPHIDPSGEHETWLDVEHREAYERLFGKAQLEFNEKQKRKDRKIDDYYEHIKKDKQKKPVYEMIIGVYNTDLDRKTKKDICRQFCKEWKARNPNLRMIGAYWHADEPGQEHVHIDYIPVGTGYKKGMRIQSSLTRAFEQMGFKTKHKNETAQMMWERRENLALEKMCNEHELMVLHPQAGRPHLEKDSYEEYIQLMEDARIEAYEIEQKAKKEARNTRAVIIEELEKGKTDLDSILTEVAVAKREKSEIQEEVDVLKEEKAILQSDVDSLEDMKSGLKTEVAELEEEVEKVRGQIDEQKLEDDINELLVTQIQEVLAPIENNPRIQKVGKIDVSKYKETAFDKSKVIVPKADLELFYDFNMTATIKAAVNEKLDEIKASVMGFIGAHKKKIESMPAWEKYLDERKKKADEYMKQAEDAKREAEDLKKNEEKNILEKAREIIGRLMLSVDIDPDKGDRGYRALCYIKENGLADDFEKYEDRTVRQKLKKMKQELDE